MSTIPGSLDVDAQPPMTVPLQHFVVGLGFLLLGGLLGVVPVGTRPTLAHLHALLIGWVCLTILGAMTQFVPVWAGVTLHSERLARGQLWLVTVGLVGFLGAFVWGALDLLPVAGGLLVLGFWVFGYNIGRTLLAVASWDVTERHFALALGYFALVVSLGFVVAVDFTTPLLPVEGVTRANVVQAHATLAVFGAVLTTVFGALYQLGTMFTQTELHGADVPLRRFEEVAYPLGVVLLAGGRLVGAPTPARVGGVLVALGGVAVSVILARRLVETSVDWNPMLVRYAVVAPAMALWALLALVAWWQAPLRAAALLGAPGASHLLVFGVLGFVVLGTVYHIVPFIVWVHRYSDQLGYEKVPLVDDLYDARLANVDFVAVLGGGSLVAAVEFLDALPWLRTVGGGLAMLGFALFVTNMLLVVHRHGPQSVRGVFGLGSATADETAETTKTTE